MSLNTFYLFQFTYWEESSMFDCDSLYIQNSADETQLVLVLKSNIYSCWLQQYTVYWL